MLRRSASEVVSWFSSGFRRRVAILLAGGILVAGTAEPIDPSKAITQFGHDVWTDELPQNTIHTILQTKDGYLWLGTYEGLVRFDGIRFTVFDSTRPGQIRGTTVSALHEDSEGNLWIATNGGLSRLRDGVFSNWRASDGLASDVLTALSPGAAGELWIGTDRGLTRFAAGRFSRFGTAEGLPSNAIRSLAFDPLGNLWVGTDRGLVRMRGEEIQTFGLDEGLPHLTVRALRVDAKGDLWIGTNRGLTRIRGGAVETWDRTRGLPDDFVWTIRDDRDGNLWVGFETGGLARFRDGGVEVFGASDGLSHAFVRSIFEDREGSLWVGTNGGLNRFRDGKFTVYSTREGLAHDFARTVIEDRAGRVWIGTDGGGVSVWDGRSFRSWSVEQGLANASVRSLLEDAKGRIWVGTRLGLSVIDGEKVSRISAGDGLGGDLVRALVERRDGSIWVGTEGGGVSEVRGDRVTHTWTTRQGISNNDVRSLHEDRSGNLWIGTYGGLDRLAGETITRFSTRDGLSNDIVFAFLEDREGRLWVGTDSGLNLWTGSKFQALTTAQGLCDNKIFQIFEDDDGGLWTSSNKGICRLDREGLLAVAAGRVSKVPSQSFNRSDGMPTNQCNGSSQPAGTRTRDGRLWFPTVKGVVVLDPRAIRRNTLPPPVRIEELDIDGVRSPAAGKVVVPPGAEKLEFHYTGLSFLAPERVRFRHRLVGYDHAWIDVGTRRVAYYTSLAPGPYRFEVLACNNDGVWSASPAVLDVVLVSPVWRTPWAAALAFLLTVVLVNTGVRWRTRALRRRNERLEAAVTERTVELDRKNDELAEKVRELEASEQRAHESETRALEASRAKSVFLSSMSHELRTPLNSIIGFTEILQEKAGDRLEVRHRRFLSNILGSGQHLLGLINDILDLSKIEAGKMELFPEPFVVGQVLEGVRSLMRGVTDSKGIEVEFDLSPDLPAVTADPGKFKQVMFNLLSNAVKFSPNGSTVTVRARRLSAGEGPFPGAGVRIDVIDRGIGISPEDQDVIFDEFRQADTGTARQYEGTGLGLSLVRRLLELHGGAVSVESTPGKGSVFTVCLPLVARSTPVAVPPPVRREADPSMAARPRVLVIEDDPAAFHTLANLLEAEGYEAVNARHKDEALRLLESEKPSLITLDIVLPGADGWEVLRELKSREDSRDLPVVVVSMLGNRELGLALGARDVFVKPVRRDELIRRIRDLVPTTGGGAAPKILLVDDDPDIADLFAAPVEAAGYRLLVAGGGAEGIALARSERPAVVVLDLMMPETSGFDVAAALSTDPATAGIPVVVLTAAELSSDDRARLEGRISALVRKGPEARGRLMGEIRKLLRHSGVIPRSAVGLPPVQ